MKFEGREIDDQIIAACRQRMSESEFGRKDLLAIIRPFRLSPDLAERIAENLIHEAGINGEIVETDGQDDPTWVPMRKDSPSSKISTGIDNKTSTAKPKRKPPLPSAQLDLFAGI
jgi:hypothetical protein